MKLSQIATVCALVSTATFTQAKPIWQDFSVSGLYGEDYQHIVTKDKQNTITLEYAAKLNHGDIFAFVDRTDNDVSGKGTYFEVAPRLSLGAVTGQKLELGPIKDVLIATTWESNSSTGSNFDNILYGIGFDLAIPYFQYAGLNFYQAKNDQTADDYQLTFTYGIPFKLGSEDFLVDGFLDWSTAEKGSHASELNWTSQWKWNAGKHISADTRLYLGIEYSIWNNKFGVQDKDQNNVSALVKYHF